MKIRTFPMIFSTLVMIGIAGILVVSCRNKPMTGLIVITRCAEKISNVNYVTGESWRYIPHTQLVALDRDKPEKELKVLTEGFYAACAPDISYDGKSMLFAGQRKPEDHWQIWEMDLEKSKVRQITSGEENCIDPVYLPGNRFVFSRTTANDSLRAGNSLFAGNLDGSDIQRITFDPGTYFAAHILHDGRILVIGRQLYPSQGNQLYMVMRPDGTKAEMFYKGTENRTLSGRAREASGGKIVFTESAGAGHDSGNLISISYNRPLHTRHELTSGIHGYFHSVFPQSSGKLLVTWRKSVDERYSLYEFDPESKALGKAVCTITDYDILDAVVVEQHARPKKLPSEVDKGVKTGLLLCQDIRILDPVMQGRSSMLKEADRIEVLGLDASFGIVKVEKDGSFYLKAMADTPFRIQTVDEQGRVVNGPCDWIWLRPNERRGCIGCHEDPEQVPENIVPLSVKKSPVTIPVHISEIGEKEVELE